MSSRPDRATQQDPVLREQQLEKEDFNDLKESPTIYFYLLWVFYVLGPHYVAHPPLMKEQLDLKLDTKTGGVNEKGQSWKHGSKVIISISSPFHMTIKREHLSSSGSVPRMLNTLPYTNIPTTNFGKR